MSHTVGVALLGLNYSIAPPCLPHAQPKLNGRAHSSAASASKISKTVCTDVAAHVALWDQPDLNMTRPIAVRSAPRFSNPIGFTHDFFSQVSTCAASDAYHTTLFAKDTTSR